MNNEKLYFYNGMANPEKHHISLNAKKTVVIKDIDFEIRINDVKNLEIENRQDNKININLNPRGIISLENKRIVINDKDNLLLIIVINSEDQMQQYNQLISEQEHDEIIDYILQYTPNLFIKEKLRQKTIEELMSIKEKVFELANSY